MATKQRGGGSYPKSRICGIQIVPSLSVPATIHLSSTCMNTNVYCLPVNQQWCSLLYGLQSVHIIGVITIVVLVL